MFPTNLQIRIILILALSSITFCSCASLTPEGERVKIVTNSNEVKGCKKVGKVKSSSSSGGSGGGMVVGNHNSSVNLRNLAAELGDTLLITQDDEGIMGSDRSGLVYKCNKYSEINGETPFDQRGE